MQGHVTDSISLGPISGATVTVTDSAAAVYVRTTDVNGFYRIAAMALGSASVNVTKTGYTPGGVGASVSYGVNVVDIVLTPSAVSVHLVSVTPVGSGTITGLGSYAPGSPVTLTATGVTSLLYQFDHWNVGGVDYYTNPLNFIVSGDTPVYLYMHP